MDRSPSIFNSVHQGADADTPESLAHARSELARVCIYLENTSVDIRGLRIYGSPVSIGMGAFGIARGSARISAHWASLPPRVDILVTHGPPSAVGLASDRFGNDQGDQALSDRVKELKPLLHVFGHIHESFGCKEHAGTLFINAAQAHKKPPFIVDLKKLLETSCH